MKLHIDIEQKTVALEGTVKVAEVFNHLMSWFPENWEEWSFIQHKPSVEYKEIFVTRDVYRNPYWNPFNQIMYANKGTDTGNPIANPTFTTSNQTTINLV